MVRYFTNSNTSIEYSLDSPNCGCTNYFLDRFSQKTSVYFVFHPSWRNYILPFDENDNAHILLKAVEIQIKSAIYPTCNDRKLLYSNFVPFHAIWERLGLFFWPGFGLLGNYILARIIII